MSASRQDATAWAAGNPLGIYEKALPKGLSWMARLSLARALGFDFVEMSVDESDERLARLDWSTAERASLRAAIAETGVTVPSMCLSGHRRFPFGSHDPALRARAREIMRKAIDLSVDTGLRTIQLAGYDVYHEPSDEGTRERFIEGLRWAVDEAARSQVMLAVEIMDTPLINSITAWLAYAKRIDSPFFCVYPDLGNLSAWNNDVPAELRKGIAKIVAIHLKDTLRVTVDFPGQFRDVVFGTGCVDFAACFKTLAELSYRGPFLIEMWTEKSAEPIVEVAQARRWLLEQMRESGLPCRERTIVGELDHQATSRFWFSASLVRCSVSAVEPTIEPSVALFGGRKVVSDSRLRRQLWRRLQLRRSGATSLSFPIAHGVLKDGRRPVRKNPWADRPPSLCRRRP